MKYMIVIYAIVSTLLLTLMLFEDKKGIAANQPLLVGYSKPDIRLKATEKIKSLDESNKIIFFENFLDQMNSREKGVLEVIYSGHQINKSIVQFIYLMNAAMVCYVLFFHKKNKVELVKGCVLTSGDAPSFFSDEPATWHFRKLFA